MSVSKTRIKVARATLIERLSAEKERAETAHVKAIEKYEHEREVFLANLTSAASDLISDTNASVGDPVKQERIMERTESKWSANCGALVEFPTLRWPSKPDKLAKTADIDRMIRILEAADDEYISIAADDQYARYL